MTFYCRSCQWRTMVGKMIFTGTQIQNDILLDLYLYIMNDYLVTKLNA
jgi:hypothetical protein